MSHSYSNGQDDGKVKSIQSSNVDVVRVGGLREGNEVRCYPILSLNKIFVFNHYNTQISKYL
jgi:hypothetical protein